MSRLAWVVGSGGMLGRAICRRLHCEDVRLFLPTERFDWNSTTILCSQIEAAALAFSAQARLAGRWEIYWAAGAGTMGSSADALAPEKTALAVLLQAAGTDPYLANSPGTVAFASSAGGIYAGAHEDIITERTCAAPTTPYAQSKLDQETLIRDFVASHPQSSAVLARISTLYGQGQSFGKKQGLLTHIARCMIRNQPVQIFVPFDTIRDYIAADDAATTLVAASQAARNETRVLLKIIASEQPVTIAGIVSLFKRVGHRPLRVITSSSRLSGLYSRHIQFRSIVLPEQARTPTRPLLVGIAQLLQWERAAYVQGNRSQGSSVATH